MQVSKSVTSRSSAQLEAQSTDGSWTPAVGQPVKVQYESSTKFVGVIDVVETHWDGHTTLLRHSLSCLSYDAIASRRVVETPIRYDRGGAGAMFSALVTSYLGGENIAITVDTGPTIGPIDIAPGATVEEALDRLAELSGMYWDIVGEPGLPQFRAFARGSYTAPVSITTSSDGVLTRVNAKRTRQGYANRVYNEIADGSGLETAHDQFGDGATRSFEIPTRAAQVISVTVDGASRTLAIIESGTTANFYWQPGSTTITQDATGTILTATQLLSVAFTPIQDLVVLGAENTSEITARQLVEGGSGRHEVVIRSSDVTVSAPVEASAAYLDAHDEMPTAAHLGILALGSYAGIDIGQLIAINLPAAGLSGSFLIETMEMASSRRLDDALAHTMEYTITCSQGQSATSDWRKNLADGLAGGASGPSTVAFGGFSGSVWVEE